MRTVWIFTAMVAAALASAQVSQAQASQGQDAKAPSNPVADATRAWLQVEAKNLTAAAEEMPADKYDFRPTPEQMTFKHLMVHIGTSNRIMCSSIADEAQPKGTGVTDQMARTSRWST